MKLTVVMAMSANGRITRGDEAEVTNWTSAEDKKQFADELAEAKLMIMGAATYEVHREVQNLSGDKLRIVLTTDPDKYAAERVENKREFYNMPPEELVRVLEERGYTEGLLLGGAATNKGFFEAGLVSELIVTIEPKLFGSGRPLIEEGNYWPELQLIDSHKLNNAGTLLLRYKIIQPI